MNKKIKTKSSVSKRFKKVSYNKLKYKKNNLKHILSKKSSKRKRFLRKKRVIKNKKILALIPY